VRSVSCISGLSEHEQDRQLIAAGLPNLQLVEDKNASNYIFYATQGLSILAHIGTEEMIKQARIFHRRSPYMYFFYFLF
jgi:hypothetical protein